ncbi:hypothetical protein ACX3VG_13560 [Escherichia coli]
MVSKIRCTAHIPVSYTHLRAHETRRHRVCRLLLENGIRDDVESRGLGDVYKRQQ